MRKKVTRFRWEQCDQKRARKMAKGVREKRNIAHLGPMLRSFKIFSPKNTVSFAKFWIKTLFF
jgi:hypothetical protein